MSRSTLSDITAASDQVLTCRNEGHRWVWVTDEVTERRGHVTDFVQVRRCSRCKVRRERKIEVPSMRVVGNTYTYPENYLMTKGHRTTGVEVRREVLVRVLNRRSS